MRIVKDFNGKVLVSERILKGITVEKLAEELDVSPVTIKNWEKGRSCPKIDKVNQMSVLFGIHNDSHWLKDQYKDVSKEELAQRLEMLSNKVSEMDNYLCAIEERLIELEERSDSQTILNMDICVKDNGKIVDYVKQFWSRKETENELVKAQL